MAILFDWYENPKSPEQQGGREYVAPASPAERKGEHGPAPCPYSETLYVD